MLTVCMCCFVLLQIMSLMFFNSSEELVLYKKCVLTRLLDFVPRYETHFRHSQRCRRNNPNKIPLTEYTLDALFFVVCSVCLSNNDMIPILQSNYGTTKYPFNIHTTNNILTELEEEFLSSELFLNFKINMSKHVAGMLSNHQYEDVMKLYRQYLTPRHYEKKNLGQVFTPFILIDKILDHIPPDVMCDPNSTFFDPSAGMGGFLVVLYKRLMTSLCPVIPNKEKRHDHIISKMLYASEITKNNVTLMKRIFGKKLHVYCGDTLQLDTEEKMRKVFGISKMRVVVGNPPFEKPQDKESQKTAGDSLWDDFVRASLQNWLLPDGYFGMLLPPGWRKPSDSKSRCKDLWAVMSNEHTPLWIYMMDANEATTAFNNKVFIRADLILLKKKINNGHKTYIVGANQVDIKMDIRKLPFLPNSNLRYWKKMLTNNTKQGNEVLYSRSMYGSDKNTVRKNMDNTYKYKVIHGIHKDGGCIYIYTNVKDKKGGFGIPKVIFNRYGGWNKPLLDLKGKYGMSQDTFALPVSSEKEGRAMTKYFDVERLKMFSEDLHWATSRPSIFWKVFRHIRKDFYHSGD